MSLEIRPIREDELDAFIATNGSSFGYEARPEVRENISPFFEMDRTLAVFDGPEIVSTTSIFSFSMTTPGGQLPVAGVTWVAVKPTHRRRGILTQMMRRQLNDVQERGEAIAALWASESQIYGRFGYGMAAEGCEVRIDRAHTALAVQRQVPGRLRMVTRDEALACWPAVYDRVWAQQPGMMSRSEGWWRGHAIRQQESRSGGWTPSFFVQYEEEGEVQGYVKYRRKEADQDGVPAGEVRVSELIAATDNAYHALWQYVFGIDLVAKIELAWRPVDDPVVHMLADSRRLVRRPQDTLWLRMLDIPAALSGRRYAAEGRLVFEVDDAFVPGVAGRYELEGGPEGAVCRRSTATPDLRLTSNDVAAAYLGGVRFQTLKRAGRVEGDAEALGFADQMFAWDPLPWCPEVF